MTERMKLHKIKRKSSLQVENDCGKSNHPIVHLTVIYFICQ